MSFCGWIKSAWDILHLIDTFFLYSLWTEAYRFLFFYYKRKGALFLSGRGYDQHYLSDLFLYSKTEIKPFLILPNNQSDDSKDYDDYIDDNKPMILLEIFISKLLHVTENSEGNSPCRILQVHFCSFDKSNLSKAENIHKALLAAFPIHNWYFM